MEPIDELQDHLTQSCVEYVACVNGPDDWRVHGRGPLTDDRIYDVDPKVDTGPVVIVRRSDGKRFCVDVIVDVWPEAPHLS